MGAFVGPAPTSKERLAVQVLGVPEDPMWRVTAGSTSSVSFLGASKGRSELVEPDVGAVTDRFCVDVGEQWAMPVLGVVCAVWF